MEDKWLMKQIESWAGEEKQDERDSFFKEGHQVMAY